MTKITGESVDGGAETQRSMATDVVDAGIDEAVDDQPAPSAE